MIKVLQIGMTANIGGVETYLFQQYQALDKEEIGYDFVNITAEDPMVYEKTIKKEGGRVFSICSRHKNPFKHYYQWVRLLLKHRNEYQAMVLNSNSLAYVFPLFLAKLFHIPIRIIHSHNSNYEGKISWRRKLLVFANKKLLFWSATDYWACSEIAGRWMFGERSFEIIHNAIYTENYNFNSTIRNRIRSELNMQDKFVIGHVGRFTYQKNHLFLIEIFKEIKKAFPHSVLVLVGSAVGDDSIFQAVQKRIQEYDLADSVMFMGLRDDVNLLMQAMDCLLLPSRFEGFPLVGIEAQTAGLECFFSSTITREIKITNLVNYISLEENAKNWAENILSKKREPRRGMAALLKENGYDVQTEVSKLSAFYREKLSRDLL